MDNLDSSNLRKGESKQPLSTQPRGCGCLVFLVLLFAIMFTVFFIFPKSDKPDSKPSSSAAALDIKDQRALALALDQQIYQQVQNSQKALSDLTSVMSSAADGLVPVSDLLVFAKNTKVMLNGFFDNLIPLTTDQTAEYAEAARIYVTNAKGFFDNTISYLESPNDEQLAWANSRADAMPRYILEITSKRAEYLINQGFSEDEAWNIISPESESSAAQ